MRAYAIYQAKVLDPVAYEEYKAQAEASIAAAGGKYIVRGGDVEVLEGQAPHGRVVILEFPSMPVALEWYRSERYTVVRQLRDGVADAHLFVVDGIDA